jgi:hypothetical protein
MGQASAQRQETAMKKEAKQRKAKAGEIRHEEAAEQLREALESQRAREALASTRDRMVDIGRGHQQAGRQRS